MNKNVENVQLGDYEGVRKACAAFAIVGLVGSVLLLSLKTDWKYLAVLGIVVLTAVFFLLCTRSKLRSRFNTTGRIHYYDDHVVIQVRGTKYSVRYDEILKIDYYAPRKRQKGKGGVEYTSRYEVLITTRDNKTLRLSTAFGKYYPDFLHCGLFNLLVTCQQNMTTEAQHETDRRESSYDPERDYIYRDVIYPLKDDIQMQARRNPHGQQMKTKLDNGCCFGFLFEPEHLVITDGDGEKPDVRLNQKYDVLRCLYIFEKFMGNANIGKVIVLRVLYDNYKYKDIPLEICEVTDKRTRDDYAKLCKIIMAANAFIERARI